jgi:hypothetical protein
VIAHGGVWYDCSISREPNLVWGGELDAVEVVIGVDVIADGWIKKDGEDKPTEFGSETGAGMVVGGGVPSI